MRYKYCIQNFIIYNVNDKPQIIHIRYANRQLIRVLLEAKGGCGIDIRARDKCVQMKNVSDNFSQLDCLHFSSDRFLVVVVICCCRPLVVVVICCCIGGV